MINVSIIMPVYNAEKVLHRSINSIISQTYKCWELILINDGSTDNSGYICDEFSRKDDRIKVIHKINEGVAVARQIGNEKASGDFIIHHDADDWVDSDMLEKMVYAIGDNDVLITDFYKNNDLNEVVVKQEPTNCSDNIELLNDLFSKLHGNCWSKLVRKSFIEHYNIRFFKGINYCEDLLFWIQAFSINNIKVKYLSTPFYHYYCPIHTKTLSSDYSKEMLKQGKLFIEKMEIYLPISVRSKLVIRHKLSVKMGAFEHPIYSHKEYYDIYPEVNKYILKLNTSVVNKILMYLSYNGFYKIATRLYQFKLKIKGKYVR